MLGSFYARLLEHLGHSASESEEHLNERSKADNKEIAIVEG